MTDPREVVGEGKRDQTALDQTLQELIKMRKKNKNIFEFYIEDKGHHFGKEDGDQDAARDNTTPLMRKVPESEGDRMRSALQEVLVSGWVGRPESSAIYKASSRMSHLTPVKWLLMRLLETRAGHHSAVYTD